MDQSNTSYGRLAQELAGRSLTAVVLESTSTFLVLLLGFSGNALVCFAVFRNPSLRTSCNYLIVSLAMTDVALSLLCLPPSLVVLITGRMLLPDWLCQTQAYLVLCFGSISLATITQSAIYRYLKVVHPNHCFKTKTVLRIIAFTWILFLFFPCPYFSSSKAIFYPGEVYCFIRVEAMPKSLVWPVMITLSVVPLSIITYCYTMIFAKVRKHKQSTRKNLQASTSRSQSRRFSPEETRITMVLVAVVIGFVICWAPVFCVKLLSFYKVSMPRKAHLLSSASAALSSCVNPFIYGVLNKDFQNEFKKIFKRFRCTTAAVAPTGQQEKPGRLEPYLLHRQRYLTQPP